MKKRLLTLALALLMTLLCACGNGGGNEEQVNNNKPTDRDQQENEVTEQTEPVYVRVKGRRYLNGELDAEMEYEYDEQGYLVKEIVYAPWSSYEHRVERIYKNDENGKILEMNSFVYSEQDRQGILFEWSIIEYNDAGIMKSLEYSYTTYTIVDGYIKLDSWNSDRYEYEAQYKDGGFVEIFEYEDGELSSRSVCEEGRLISEEWYQDGEVAVHEEHEYRAGSDERTISRYYFLGDLMSETKYYYDSHGNLIRTEDNLLYGVFGNEYDYEFEYELLENIR